ncbi:hypothetical protein NDU88_005150 [Pleurodeles waltl]|uniref:Uncharacterized protein n=1 Tax=Pleurodeles waltl TaxID=8319 RepID=A0AAV7V3R9_PLEWA|nr:hypothetical protein NDU88_005150 [Pleurodeles waltl]
MLHIHVPRITHFARRGGRDQVACGRRGAREAAAHTYDARCCTYMCPGSHTLPGAEDVIRSHVGGGGHVRQQLTHMTRDAAHTCAQDHTLCLAQRPWSGRMWEAGGT